MTDDPRISEIRAVLDACGDGDGCRCPTRIRAILDRPEPQRPEDFTLADLTGTAEDRVESVLEAFGVNVADMRRFVTALVRCVPDEEPPPAPRVFFPGDTWPGDAYLVNSGGGVLMPTGDPKQLVGGPYVELRNVPSPEEWQAAVDRAIAEREVSP